MIFMELEQLMTSKRTCSAGGRSAGCFRAGVVSVMVLAACGGCMDTGGASFGEEPEEKPAVTYKGLASQKCAVLVWADGRTRSEYNQVQVDLARAFQDKLMGQMPQDKSGKPDATAPQFIDPRSVVRYQREHPETESLPIVEVAPRLGVGRVVYIEVEQLQLQSPRSILLLKGDGAATLRVVEVAEGKAKIAFEEAGIAASYPKNAPEGVVPTDKINERTIYEGTLAALAGKLAARFEGK